MIIIPLNKYKTNLIKLLLFRQIISSLDKILLKTKRLATTPKIPFPPKELSKFLKKLYFSLFLL